MSFLLPQKPQESLDAMPYEPLHHTQYRYIRYPMYNDVQKPLTQYSKAKLFEYYLSNSLQQKIDFKQSISYKRLHFIHRYVDNHLHQKL